jgi:hypothetical protein
MTIPGLLRYRAIYDMTLARALHTIGQITPSDADEMNQEKFSERARFLIELARRLHQFGTAAPRLEAAIERVMAKNLRVRLPIIPR